MHGYTPGEIEPTTEMLLAHKYPHDRDKVAETITRSVELGEPFSSRHRFIDTHGVEHQVMVVADRIFNHDHTVGTAGFYIDLSSTLLTAEHEALDTRIQELVNARAAIEQAKGVLIRMYRIGDEQAFKLLVWRSQETNTTLRALTEQRLRELPAVPPDRPDTVSAFDHILLTLHERIPPDST
ncbi:ANTAR domain-containing protein [Nocardia sp. CA-151230]|uniref:ANTAR domain-containing protein n=1 Tax=Nocardia sp. CA-151230 TaxID=3239982 RepID=UPI003D8A747A